MTDSPWIKRGFQLAAAINVLGVLLFSKGFTNAYLSELDPHVFSRFGLLVIIVWGLAYLATAGCYRQAKWIVAVFAVEKLLYTGAWVLWTSRHDLGAVFERSPLTGAFYAISGPNDFLFALFFGWVFLKVHRQQ